MKTIKLFVMAFVLLAISQSARAQVTTAQIREQIANGECETAQALYNVYKAMNGPDKTMERMIAKCGEEKTSVSGSANGHEYVDLGLPSGTLWATCNVGASNPEDYGNYYALGETETKKVYNWDTYKYALGEYKVAKYFIDGYYFDKDNPAILEKADDAATSNWGGGWRTPSKMQWDELLQYTNNQWTSRNGVEGRLFTSKKNGKSIFFPAAGNRLESELNHCGFIGFYWSTEFGGYKASAYYLYLDSEDCSVKNYYCDLGFSVRPVREK